MDAAIEPHAFRLSALWGEERDAAISVCAQIGVQLMKPFLAREKSKKGKTINNAALDEDAQKWSLGAAGFASMIVFSSSIPKPVLPLLWLAGKVTLNGKTIDWRPLFWDARRTNEAG